MTAQSPPTNRPTAGDQLEIFRRTMLIRICDEKIIAAIKASKIVAPFYSPRGHEIISAAVMSTLRDTDYVVTIYRGLHDHLAKGVPPRDLIAEYAGRLTGSCKGKGGPMHITHPESGVMVTTGIVGSSMPIANGLAWASQLKGEDRVTVATFGDGASNIGAFHEALNLASLWKLPVIFLCQNNGYGEHTRYEVGTSVGSVADRSTSYSMEGVCVDGHDPVAVWTAAKRAVEKARAGEGPTLLEAVTRRLNGHVLGDGGEYIDRDEFASWVAADPVPRFRARLIDGGIATSAELDGITAEISATIDEAIEFAVASPFPDTDELVRDVYSKEMAA